MMAVPFAATLLAAVVGVVYVLSPMAVWFLLAMGWLLRHAWLQSTGRERAWIMGVLIGGLLARVLVLAALVLSTDHNAKQFGNFMGDEQYTKHFSLVMRNGWLGIPVPTDFFLGIFSGNPYGRTAYHQLVAYLQVLVGPSPYGLHLFSAALFMTGAVLMHRLMRSAYGAGPALAGLAFLLFYPSLLIWSISALKESLLFLLTAIVIREVVGLVRLRGARARLAAAAMLVGALAALGPIRAGGLGLVAAGLACGLIVSVVTAHRWALLPVLLALGIGYHHYVTTPAVGVHMLQRVHRAASLHFGHVNTRPGHAYRVLDQRLYSHGVESIPTMTQQEAARFVIRASVAFILVPLPGQVITRPELAYLPEQFLWYAVVLLACVGAIAGFSRDALVTSLLTGYVVVASAAIALTSGNIGTLVRHRGMVTPFIVWIAGMGAVWLAARTAGAAEVVVGARALDAQGRTICL